MVVVSSWLVDHDQSASKAGKVWLPLVGPLGGIGLLFGLDVGTVLVVENVLVVKTVLVVETALITF